MKNNKKISKLISLNILLLIYSLSSVFSKFASQQEFMSIEFIFWYGLVVLLLGVYAIFWQQIIKHLPLNTAYANKAVVVVWGILWGMLFFGETIHWNKIVGAIIVIIGVVMVVINDE
ncbi:MAG: EamA family transporter [Acutalibacteraceae bacterium]|jgi:drug/metabolite transporter (DMT)-like permease